jgi:hypothetical protein
VISRDPIIDGDALASQSCWRAAVAQWVEASKLPAPELRVVAEQRLRWLIHEAGAPDQQRNSERELRRNAYRVLMLAVLSGAIATALIILGMYTEEGTSPVLAIGGWIGIIVSMACAIFYAFRLSNAQRTPKSAPLTVDEIARARELAEALDREVAAPRPAIDDTGA